MPNPPITDATATAIMMMPCMLMIRLYIPSLKTASFGSSSCTRISIANKPATRNRIRNVVRYWMPMTLWSNENARKRRSPVGSWALIGRPNHSRPQRSHTPTPNSQPGSPNA